MTKVLRREEPVTHDGPEISLPYRGAGALGQGKALKSIMHPPAPIPIWLASGGPKNTELCAELCDGWLPIGLGPNGMERYRPILERGFSRRREPSVGFDIFTGCSVTLTDDVGGVLDAMRPLTAMYVGGMGSSTHNYHREAMGRRGFPEAAARIQELWLAGRKEEARQAVPVEYLEQSALVGSAARIKQRWERDFAPLEAAGVTGVVVSTDQPEALDLLAELGGTREKTA
jgi:alkanesulfonate monooxygenase SsuD/methylene tetrahydromethanopterin reductase-like flavin-dependent oxidoreductase (luciferase family)